MAATVRAAFELIDRASSTLRKIERQAQATDRALAKASASADRLGSRDQISRMDMADQRLRKLQQSTDRLGSSAQRARPHIGGIGNDFETVATRARRAENDVGRLERVFQKIGTAGKALGTIFTGMKLPLIATAISALLPAVGSLGLGLTSLLPKLTDLGAGVIALPAPMLAAGAAMVTVKLATHDLGKALAGNKRAFDSLTPSAKRFVETLRSYRPMLAQLRTSAQRGLFPGLTQGLQKLSAGAPVANRLVGMFGSRIGQAANQAATQLTAPGALSDFNRLGNQGGRLFTEAASGALNLASALRNLMVAAMPFTNWLSQTILGWTQWASAQAMASRESGQFAQKLNRTRSSLETLGHIARNLWQTFRGIGEASRPLGDQLYKSIEKTTAGWKDFTNSVGGQYQMTKLFIDSKPALEATVGLFGDLAKALGRLMAPSAASTGFVQTLRGIVPPLEKAVHALAQGFGPAAADAIVQVAKAFAVIAGSMSVVTRGLQVFDRLLGWVNQLIERFPVLGTAIQTAVGVVAVRGILSKLGMLQVGWLGVAKAANTAAAAEGRAVAMSGAGGLSPRAMTQAEASVLAAGGRGLPRPTFGAGIGAAIGSAAAGAARFAAPIALAGGAFGVGTGDYSGGTLNRIAQALGYGVSGASFGLIPNMGNDSLKRSLAPFQMSPGDRVTPNFRFGSIGAAIGPIATLGQVGPYGTSRSQSLPGAPQPGSLFSSVNQLVQARPQSLAQAQALQQGSGILLGRLQSGMRGVTDPKAQAVVQSYIDQVLNAREALKAVIANERALAVRTKALADARQTQKDEGFLGLFGSRAGRQFDRTVGRRGIVSAAGTFVGQFGRAIGQAKDPTAIREFSQQTLNQSSKWFDGLKKGTPQYKAIQADVAALNKTIEDRFAKMGQTVSIVNGKILTGSKSDWQKINAQLVREAELAKTGVANNFAAIQQEAVAALQLMGLTKQQATAYSHAAAGTTTGTPGAFGMATPGMSGAATGGRISGNGLKDTVSIRGKAAPGELIVNRHTERRINGLLGGKTTLGREVAGETTPHDDVQNGIMPGFARGGRVPGAGGSPIMKAIMEANQINSHHYPYAWGGGHGAIGVPSAGTLHSTGGPVNIGYDCSGAVSAVLGSAGYLSSPRVSGALMNFGVPGYQANGINVLSNPTHTYMIIHGRAFGTSSANSQGGAGWFGGGIRSGFAINHMPNPGSIGIPPLATPPTPFGLQAAPKAIVDQASKRYAGGLTGSVNARLSRSMGFAYGGRYGKGGAFTATKPMMITVGDGGPEHVTVTPAGKRGRGGGMTLIGGNLIVHGGGNGDEIAAKVEQALMRVARELDNQEVVGGEEALT